MQGQVNLETRLAPGGVTRTAALSFTAPYSLMHPFVRPDFTEYMVMSSSAGLLAGDSNEFDFRFGACQSQCAALANHSVRRQYVPGVNRH